MKHHRKYVNAQDGDRRQGDADKWYVDSEIEFDDGRVLLNRHIMPKDVLEWRAAEYNIPPNDYDTLIDIVMCEPYISQDWYESENALFNAPTIDIAREAYLAKVAEVKLRERISTRGKGHPLNHIRREASHEPMRMCLKAASVIMQRVERGVQEIDPHVFQTLAYLNESLARATGRTSQRIDPEQTLAMFREGYPSSIVANVFNDANGKAR